MDLIKQLTGKNQSDYEQAAAHIINSADVNAFKELIDKDDFLFDFIKQNVVKRLERVCNEDNYRNLLKFTTIYSPTYDDFIAGILAKFADEEICQIMLDKLNSKNEDEMAYAAKFFCYVHDDRAIVFLKQNAYSEFEPLALNSASALASMNEKTSLNDAIIKLNSDDDFGVLSAVKFLSAYGDKNSLPKIFEIMKKSSVSEYIACEIGYMESFLNLLESNNYENTLLAIYHILQGLGEIIPISDIFTFQLFEVFEKLIFSEPNSKNAVILLTAKNKFNQLTENDEYLFDEDKNTKTEVNEIKKLLNDNLDNDLDQFILPELNENSDFIYPALDLIKKSDNIRPLLMSKNQTIILKSLEIMKSLNELSQKDKDIALANISDENIKAIILAL